MINIKTSNFYLQIVIEFSVELTVNQCLHVRFTSLPCITVFVNFFLPFFLVTMSVNSDKILHDLYTFGFSSKPNWREIFLRSEPNTKNCIFVKDIYRFSNFREWLVWICANKIKCNRLQLSPRKLFFILAISQPLSKRKKMRLLQIWPVQNLVLDKCEFLQKRKKTAHPLQTIFHFCHFPSSFRT